MTKILVIWSPIRAFSLIVSINERGVLGVSPNPGFWTLVKKRLTGLSEGKTQWQINKKMVKLQQNAKFKKNAKFDEKMRFIDKVI